MIRTVGVGMVVVAASLSGSIERASAQSPGPTDDSGSLPQQGSPRWEWGAEVLMAQPVGEFADYVAEGSGFTLFGVRYFDEARRVGVRLDVEVLSYGSETVRLPLSPSIPFVDVDVTTDNVISSFALGPQVLFGSRRLQPYIRGAVGVSEFATTTSVRSSVTGLPNALPFASTENFDNHTWLMTAGGGFRWTFSREARHPVGLHLGGAFAWHGITDYLREGSLREGPDGEPVLVPVRSETNLGAIHFGVTVGSR